MNFVKRIATLAVLALALTTVIWSAPAQASVTSPSPGCQALNDPARDGRYQDANSDGFGIGVLSVTPLAAGETVTITTTSPSAGLTLTTLSFYDMAVSFAPIVSLRGPTPGSVSYTLTSDWNGPQQSLGWSVAFANLLSDQADFDVSCTPAPPNPSADSSASEFPEYTLDMAVPHDSRCAASEISAVRGEWVTLPSKESCYASGDNPQLVLLGWSTLSDFATEIAQRQVDNGWGAYETFDDNGRLTGVFIPAGGATLVTAPGRLYAIWSNPASN